MNRDEMIADAKRAGELGDHDLELHILKQVDAMQPSQSWGDVGSSALKNLPKDLSSIGAGTIEAVKHPINTANALLDVAEGGVQSIPGVGDFLLKHGLSEQDNRAKAAAFAQPFKQDFGSMEGFKRAVAERPANTALNVLTGVTGLSGLAKAGAKAAAPVARGAGATVGQIIGDIGTHTGGETIRDAARAGFQGGAKLEALTSNMRNKVPQSAIVDLEKQALANIAKYDSSRYTKGMEQVVKDKAILDYASIEKAARDALSVNRFKGVSVNPETAKIQDQITRVIEEWSGKPIPIAGALKYDAATGQFVRSYKPGVNPSEFHTIEGFDQLKKKIGNIRKGTQQGTPERVVADSVYRTIRDKIAEQSPAYDALMKQSQAAIKNRKEISKELSLGENVTDSTALRKSLAIPRNNANTNYGNRISMAQQLEGAGADNLMTMLNGQALNSWKPRGLGGLVSSGLGGYGLASMNPAVVPFMLSQSPRAMGELAVLAGKAGKGASKLSKAAALPYDKLKIPGLINLLIQQQQQAQ